MINRMSLKVNINVEDGVWKPGLSLINDPKYRLNKLPIDDKNRILNSFVRFLAKRMRKLLKDRIKNQYPYLKKQWKPLTPGYLEFKKKAGLSTDIWNATGLLLKSISYHREGEFYVIGIDPKVKYPNSNVSVLFVAKCMEFGTRYMPARPLFGPTVVFMRRNIRQYWELFLEETMRLDPDAI